MKRAVDDRIFCGHASAAMASKLVCLDGVDVGSGGVAVVGNSFLSSFPYPFSFLFGDGRKPTPLSMSVRCLHQTDASGVLDTEGPGVTAIFFRSLERCKLCGPIPPDTCRSGL